MRRKFPWAWRAVLRLFVLLGTAPFGGAQTGLLMPMYGNTSTQFAQIYEAALKVPVIAILNPDNGAGLKKDSFIAGKINQLKSRGVKIIGYISTGYGNRDSDEVDGESDKYKLWYGVGGIFLDEVSGSSSKLTYYKNIKAYAKLIGIGYTVLNPGTAISSTFLQAGDVIVDYEHANWQLNFATASKASWVASNPTRAAAIVYGAAASEMQAIINTAIAKKYRWIYVTDKNEPDPFGISASYFSAEVDYLYALNNPLPPALSAADFKVLSSVLSSPVPGAAPDRMVITASTVAGRTYEVQCSSTLAAGSWRTATDATNGTPLLRGVSQAASHTWNAALPQGTAPQCFFRVVDVTP